MHGGTSLPAAPTAQYSFGPFTIDAARLRLIKDGVVIRVPPRVFDALYYLVEHRERVISAVELLDEVWPGVAVQARLVGQVVSRARRALEQPRGARSPICTVYKRGYQFVASVELV
jgi:DNA-binding winged helix-turn-helix (wHTH) protein